MSHDHSDLFAAAARLNADNGNKLAVQKKRDSGDLFKSAWSFGNEREARSGPKLSRDSMLSTGLYKYSPDQPRDDDGRWVDDGGGGGGVGSSSSLQALNAAASGVTADDPASADRFLEASRAFVADVKEGKVEPTPSMWQRMLTAGGKVLERLAESVEVVAISAGAGAAVGTLAARGVSRAFGFKVGAAVAGTLGVAMIYDEWANNRAANRLKHESARLKNNIHELEYALGQFKSQRSGSDD
jgi:hypothetical protein